MSPAFLPTVPFAPKALPARSMRPRRARRSARSPRPSRRWQEWLAAALMGAGLTFAVLTGIDAVQGSGEPRVDVNFADNIAKE